MFQNNKVMIQICSNIKRDYTFILFFSERDTKNKLMTSIKYKS